MSLITHVFNQQNTLSIDPQSVKTATEFILKHANARFNELTIYFVEEDEICKLHADFFDDPSPTDCISFPMDDASDAGYKVLGDIFINPKAAIEYAKTENSDPYEELTLYLIHGILHLLGYDDLTEEETKKMREAEKIHLDHLKAHSVYLGGVQ